MLVETTEPCSTMELQTSFDKPWGYHCDEDDD